jgi:hypothetical protein
MNEMDLLEQFCAAVPAPEGARLSHARSALLATAAAPVPASMRTRWTRPRRLATLAFAATATAAVLVLTLATPFGGSLTPPASAATLLQRAAKAALSQPAATAGQYIYTEVTGPGDTPLSGSAVVQTWQSVDGTRPGVVESRGTCGPLPTAQAGELPGQTPPAPPSSAPATPARTEPSLLPPQPSHCAAIIRGSAGSPPASTYAGLQTLPADPAALLRYLDEHYHAMQAPGQTLSTATREYLAISDILENLGVLPGRLEAAMFQALQQLPGMTLIPHVTDYAGRTGTAAAWRNGGFEFEMIFNPDTYQFMGQQEVALPGNHGGYGAGARVWGMALLASGVTSTVPSVPRTTQYCALLWQDFAAGLPVGC